MTGISRFSPSHQTLQIGLHHFLYTADLHIAHQLVHGEIASGPPIAQGLQSNIQTVLGRKRRFEYLYDYGDSWWHTITLENRLPLTSAWPGVVCIGGEMACPPEDVGGLGGYFEFLNAMEDPQHEEHESLMEWLGGAFDPRAFELIQINKRLKQIKT